MNITSRPSSFTRPQISIFCFSLVLALCAIQPATAQTVEANGAVNPFPNPNPQTDWNPGGELSVGYQGAGELIISGGGTVSNLLGYIGYGNASQGLATVTGTGSQWSNTSGLYVGYSGSGALTISDGGTASVSEGAGYIGFINSGVGTVTITGVNSQWINAEYGIYIGHYGKGELLVENGATVSSPSGTIGENSTSSGVVTVTGTGSQWNNSNSLMIGNQGTGELRIENGGVVSSYTSYLGHYNGSGSVTVTGAGSQWTNTGYMYLAGSSVPQGVGTGTLNIEKGGMVTTYGLNVWEGGKIALEVYGNDMLKVEDYLNNDGQIRLTAAPNLAAGAYIPIEAGAWSGSGSLETIGGTWNSLTHEFTVSAAQETSSGSQATVDLATTQKLQIASPQGMVLAAFNPDAQSTGGGSVVTFTATANSTETISGREVLSAWDFDTDLAFGTEIQLSLEVGAGWNPSLFAVWHSADGSIWTPFETEIFYDGSMASFFVEGFSSYAITTVPEPSAALLIFVGLAGLFFCRSRNPSNWPPFHFIMKIRNITCLFLMSFLTLGAVNAQTGGTPIGEVYLYGSKTAHFSQTQSGSAIFQTGTLNHGGEINSSVQIFNVSAFLIGSGGTSVPVHAYLPNNDFSIGSYAIWGAEVTSVESLEAFNAWYPSGTPGVNFELMKSDTGKRFNTIPGGGPPPQPYSPPYASMPELIPLDETFYSVGTPTISNGDWSGGNLRLAASAGSQIQWNEWTAPPVDGGITLQISDSGTGNLIYEGNWFSDETQVNLAGGLLVAGRTYSGTLSFSKAEIIQGYFDLYPELAPGTWDQGPFGAPYFFLTSGDALTDARTSFEILAVDYGSATSSELLTGQAFSGALVNDQGLKGEVVIQGENAAADGTISLTLSPRTEVQEAFLASDVLTLEGTGDSVFVLQMTYDEAAVLALFGSQENARLGWLDGENGWVFAINGNSVPGESGFVLGAFDGDFTLGRQGVDTENNTVWAVVDHNSEFSTIGTIPEPGSAFLLLLGVAALFIRYHARFGFRCKEPAKR